MIVKIAGIELSDFTVNDITFNYDSVSDTFSLTLPFFAYWEKSRRLFKPLQYTTVEILDNSKRKLLTGYIVNHNFKSNANSNEISISGYSKTGVLDDCPDVSNSIIQDEEENQSTCYTGLTLKQLAEALVKPYGIEIIVDDLVSAKLDEPYDQVTTDSSESIAGYLAKMATYKNVVMRSTVNGQLRFTQIDPLQKPVAKFSTGDGVVNEINLQVNGQAMHSEINVIAAGTLYEDEEEDKEKSGDILQIKNPLVAIHRPAVIKQGTEIRMIKEVTKAALADELKNITISLDCKGWKIIDDHILSPGDMISVKAPDVYLYEWTTLLIRSIQLKENANQRTSTISCVIPETMTGEEPKLIFD
jgi:prophage tail gpP-like protein